MAEEVAAPTTAAELGSIDGRIAPSSELTIPATDEGLLRGDGVFEVIRVYDGVPFALSDHLDRLERSGANLRLPDVFRGDLEAEIPELLDARGGAAFDGVLRVVITRGGRRLLLTEPAPPKPPGVRLGFVTYAPTHVLDGIKSLSYGANMLCTRLAQERGFDEALLVTPHGRVLEGPTSSFFWADRDGELWTPPVSAGLLPGTFRARLLHEGRIRERMILPAELRNADAVYLINSVRRFRPATVVE
jgi:branched-chain amino acid aminotransferase